MIESDLLNALNDSIDRMAGGATIADCLQRHPQYAEALEPLLETGQLVRRSQASRAEAEQARARQLPRYERLLAQTASRRRHFPLMRFAQWAALLVLVVGVLLAEQSLPGDELYGVKRLTENARTVLLPDTAEIFTQRRFDEARQLVNLGRAAELTLTGEIDSLTGTTLLMQGLTIITEDSPEGAALRPGMRVEILVQSTVLGELRAQEIRVLDRPEASQQPAVFTPSPEPTRTSTATPERTPEARLVEPTICVVNPRSGWIRYTVEPGETLSDLAARTGTSTQALADANCLIDSRLIVAGQALVLPREPDRRPTLMPTAEPVRMTNTPPPATRRESDGERPAQNRRPTPEDGGERGGR
jgi:hypothetical protein